MTTTCANQALKFKSLLSTAEGSELAYDPRTVTAMLTTVLRAMDRNEDYLYSFARRDGIGCVQPPPSPSNAPHSRTHDQPPITYHPSPTARRPSSAIPHPPHRHSYPPTPRHRIIYNVQIMASDPEMVLSSSDPLAALHSVMVQRLSVECLYKILNAPDAAMLILG